ncbi:GNAT family N-acetyltransferase [Brevibacillus centrosporus]|uniref:GNAT family N-acetyltransferase n=1 Tax=Brevibacillus centrosporus TaxID=54910 RepID=UPI0038032F4E
MQIPYPSALQYFQEIKSEDKCPSLHPTYLLIDAKREKGLEPTFFVFEEGGQFYYHAFHVSGIPGTAYFDIQSPYGYGGPLSTTKDPIFIERAWQSYLNWCESHSILAEFIRFHPILENDRNYRGQIFPDRSTVWIDLKADNLFANYQTRSRRKIRRAQEKGLYVEWCSFKEFMQHFPLLYEELMKELGADDFYFFPEDYFKAWQGFDAASYALCKHDADVVAGTIFYQSGDIMEYHLSAANEAGKELAATPLVIHKAAEMGKKNGCKQLHLGGGTSSDPENPLFFFKSGFSKERGSYKIGKHIHLPEVYESMKQDWEESHHKSAQRTLFYR